MMFFSLLVVVVSMAFLALVSWRVYQTLPDRIALQWGFDGTPKYYGPKWIAFASNLIPFALWIFVEWSIHATPADESGLLMAFRLGMPFMVLVFVLTSWFTQHANLNKAKPGWRLISAIIVSSVTFAAIIAFAAPT